MIAVATKGLTYGSVLTTVQAARISGLSRHTIIKCFDSGRLMGYRVPGCPIRRIPREYLIRFMRDYEIPIPLGLLEEERLHGRSTKIAKEKD